MRIACDVCNTAAAAVICSADEAALCARCDEAVHAANMLAGKHRRLPLLCDVVKLPRCDICQDKPAFILCVEDRALFCQDCDEAIHIATSLSAKHRRLLVTGIHVGFSSPQNLNTNKLHPEPSNCSSIVPALPPPKEPALIPTPIAPIPSSWSLDDFLQLSDSHEKEPSVGLGEFSWFSDIGFSDEQVSDKGPIAAAKVPEMLFGRSSNEKLQRSLDSNSSLLFKKPRVQILDDEDFFAVPDLG